MWWTALLPSDRCGEDDVCGDRTVCEEGLCVPQRLVNLMETLRTLETL